MGPSSACDNRSIGRPPILSGLHAVPDDTTLALYTIIVSGGGSHKRYLRAARVLTSNAAPPGLWPEPAWNAVSVV